MEMDEDSINSEIRYITIELMKIAAQKNITFEEAAREFLKNAIFLKRLIEITESTDQMSRVLLSKFSQDRENLHSYSLQQATKHQEQKQEQTKESENKQKKKKQ